MKRRSDLTLIDASYLPAFGEWGDGQFDRAFKTIRKFAGHDGAGIIKMLNLTNEHAIAALEKNVVDRLSKYKNAVFGSDASAIVAANNAIAMLQLLRYENLNHTNFFEEIVGLAHRNNPHFVPIIRQRVQDIVLRTPGHNGQALLPYLDIADRRAHLGDIAGWVDCQWRYSSAEIDAGDYDAAERRLTLAYSAAHTSYFEDRKIFRMTTERREDKVANIHRSLARLYRLRGRTSRASEMFSLAREHLLDAFDGYRSIKQVHGMANCIFENALLQIAKEVFVPDRVPSPFREARRLYAAAGDEYKVAVCDAYIAAPFAPQLGEME